MTWTGIIKANVVSLHDGVGVTRYGGERDPWAAEIAQFYSELTQGAERQVADANDGIEALELSLKISGGSRVMSDIEPGMKVGMIGAGRWAEVHKQALEDAGAVTSSPS